MSTGKTKRVPPDPGIIFLRDAALGLEAVLAAGPCVEYPTHCHVRSIIVGLVRSGQVRLARAGRSDCLSAGRLFVIPPHQAHSLSATGPYAMLNLCLDARKVNAGNIRAVGRALRGLVGSGAISGAEYAALNNALPRIAKSGRASPAQKANDSLDALRTGMAADPDCHSSLAGMAGAVHVCPRHFARTFRSRYGLSPMRYQKQIRLRRARMELAAGSCSLAQTALRHGFFDQSHFIREFKKLYRMTPREYLRARREFPVSKART